MLSLSIVLTVLFAIATNVNAETMDVLACTEGDLWLQCSNSEVIHLTSAMYGRLNQSQCVGENDTVAVNANCSSQTALSTLRALCDGKYSCVIRPSTSLFGDPCPTTTKYLQAEYECAACINTYGSNLNCDRWALSGECVYNYAWMSVNCRQSCWQCQDAELCSDFHNENECRFWAAIGECTRNFQWMTDNCQYSCNMCGYVDAGIPSAAYKIPYSGHECDGALLDVRCPQDYLITVTSAFYGRQDNTSCTADQFNNNAQCSVTGALAAVSSLCNNQQSCNVSVSPTVLGQDTCPSVSKYFDIQFSCTQATFTAHGCDGEDTWLNCPGSAVIRVMSVMYGRNNNSACSANLTGSTVQCQSSSALTVLSQLCNGQSSCLIIPSTSLFDDPCPGVSKYADIVFTCTACINAYGSDSQCNSWANAGQCDSNPGWMIANCRKSCWKCQYAELCTDQLDGPDCSYWAATGQCADNPSWMNVYCRRSCNKCLPSDITTPVTAQTTQPPATSTASLTTQQNIVPTTASVVRPTSEFEMEYTGLACKNEVLRVFCPSGYVIDIENAFYGRNENSTCFDSQMNYTSSCYVDSAFAVVSNMCNGLQGCDIFSAIETFNTTDPCPLTSKFFTMKFVCKQATVAAHGCDTAITWLACPASSVIRVQNVMYGRDSSSVCSNDTGSLSAQCHSQNATTILGQLCNGKPNCALIVSTALFGDPCPGVAKYANIYYTCTECTNGFGNDTACDSWAQAGECETNPGWMVAYCRKSCWNCQYAESCSNTHNNTNECLSWAANGECANNPSWMGTNCQQSCNKCTAPMTTQGITTLLPTSAQSFPTADQQSSETQLSTQSPTAPPLPSVQPPTTAPPVTVEPPTAAPPATVGHSTTGPSPSVQPPTAAPPATVEPPTGALPPSVQPPTAAPPASVEPPTAAPPATVEAPTAALPPSVQPPTAEPATATVELPRPPTALPPTATQPTTTSTTVQPPTGPMHTVPSLTTSSSAPTTTAVWSQVSLQVKMSDHWQDVYSDMTNPSTRGYANNVEQKLTSVYRTYYTNVAVSVIKLSPGSVIVDVVLAFPASYSNVTAVDVQCRTHNYLLSNMAYTTSDLATLCIEYFCGNNDTTDICSCPGRADSDPQCTRAAPVSSGDMSTTTIIIIVVCTVGSAIVIVIIVVVSVCIYRRCNSKRFRLQQPHEENGHDNAYAAEEHDLHNQKYEFSVVDKTPTSQSRFTHSELIQ